MDNNVSLVRPLDNKPWTGLPQDEDFSGAIKFGCLECGHVFNVESPADDDLDQITCPHCGSQRGFKGYNSEGEYTVFLYSGSFMRDVSEIAAKEREYFERVRYMHGLDEDGPFAVSCLKAYADHFGTFPDLTEWDAAYWHGQLAALRWVLGADENTMSKEDDPDRLITKRFSCIACLSEELLTLSNNCLSYRLPSSGMVRAHDEVRAKVREYDDRVWYERHLRHGRPKVGHKAARRILRAFPDLALPIDDWDRGYWCGHLAALRWVDGDQQHLLHT